MRAVLALSAATILVGGGLALRAQEAGTAAKCEVDPVLSFVTFKAKHLGASWTHGRFDAVSGSFVFDDKDAARSSVEIQVKTETIDTNNEKRDQHLKGPDFFSAKEFPLITFKSKSVKDAGGGFLEITGDLTLHGVTKEIAVKAEKVGEGKDPKGNVRIGFETSFTVKRSDYGMSNMVGPVGDEIPITVSIEGIRQ